MSSIVGDANNQHVSSVQSDAGLQHVSSYLAANTLGAYTVYETLALSSSTSVKGTAGAIYGFDLSYISASTPAYVKIFNIGTVPTLSAAYSPKLIFSLSSATGARDLHIQYTYGIPFSSGIGIAATSALADGATTLMAASSIIGQIYYI